jgi:hypothetical protein
MGGACSPHEKDETYTKLSSENLKETDNLEDLGTDGNIILERIFGEVVDWICLAEDRDQWRAPVNTAMNLRVPQNAGNLTS